MAQDRGPSKSGQLECVAGREIVEARNSTIFIEVLFSLTALQHHITLQTTKRIFAIYSRDRQNNFGAAGFSAELSRQRS
jgi:hypothetical protein